eukprot:11159494-Alexandrium_andersonii.AAC.1
MREVEEEVRRQVPLTFTPLFNFVDLEYADDTVLVAKTANTARVALASLVDRAGSRGLALNKGKTVELAMNSDLPVAYPDGEVVKRADK